MEDDQQPIEDDQADTGVEEQPVFTFPAPGAVQPGNNNPVFVPMPNNQINGQPGSVTAPVITLQPGANGPTIYNFVPTEGQPAPPPATPQTGFGVIGAPTPGMIQVPQPTVTPTRPPNTRPPGGN